MMKKVKLIAAVDKEMGIGKDGNLPWHIPNDLIFFKKTTCFVQDKTKTNAVVMGRKTFDSLPKPPLPNRLNVVLTKNDNITLPTGVLKFSDIKTAINDLSDNDFIESIFIIGGASIYQQSLTFCDEIILTYINDTYSCDVFFPVFEGFKSQYTFLHKDDALYREIVYYQRQKD